MVLLPTLSLYPPPYTAGATFDLRGLMQADGFYHIYDGDDPCTVQEEESFDYYFNVCGNVGGAVPSACPPPNERGSALQYDKKTNKVGGSSSSSSSGSSSIRL